MSITLTVIIPARLGSTRLPEKVLQKIGNKTLIEHSFDRASQAFPDSRILVATDSSKVSDYLEESGIPVCLTPGELPSGSARCAYLLQRGLVKSDFIVNLQADEPFISLELLKGGFDLLRQSSLFDVVTAAFPIDAALVEDPNLVKVVLSNNNQALYFSRSVIPYPRNSASALYYGHAGVYFFKQDFLKTIDPYQSGGYLAETESLEQLSWLASGTRIGCFITRERTLGIDTSEDLDLARSIYQKRMKL